MNEKLSGIYLENSGVQFRICPIMTNTYEALVFLPENNLGYSICLENTSWDQTSMKKKNKNLEWQIVKLQLLQKDKDLSIP